MNTELARLASTHDLFADRREELTLRFGWLCASRVEHLLEEPRVHESLATLTAYLDGRCNLAALDTATAQAAALANQHPGSKSLDGAAHAAVSATYAVANALAGRALDAAGYAAYASVYAYAGHAVSDPAAFEQEFAWQVVALKGLLAPQR